MQERSDLSDGPQAGHHASGWFVVLKTWHHKNHLRLIVVMKTVEDADLARTAGNSTAGFRWASLFKTLL